MSYDFTQPSLPSKERRIRDLHQQIYPLTSPQRRELRTAMQRCVQLRAMLGLDVKTFNTLIEFSATPDVLATDYALLGDKRELFLAAANDLLCAQNNLLSASKAALMALGVEEYGPATALLQPRDFPSASQIATRITMATRRNEMEAATKAMAAQLTGKQFEGHALGEVKTGDGACR